MDPKIISFSPILPIERIQTNMSDDTWTIIYERQGYLYVLCHSDVKMEVNAWPQCSFIVVDSLSETT